MTGTSLRTSLALVPVRTLFEHKEIAPSAPQDLSVGGHANPSVTPGPQALFSRMPPQMDDIGTESTESLTSLSLGGVYARISEQGSRFSGHSTVCNSKSGLLSAARLDVHKDKSHSQESCDRC
jgi:hypothetical protein